MLGCCGSSVYKMNSREIWKEGEMKGRRGEGKKERRIEESYIVVEVKERI